jgi:hypothetical protein
MRKIIFSLAILAALSSCTKKDVEEFNGTIQDFTGRLDGCRYLIQLDNGTRLEPVVIPNNITLLPGRRIAVQYIDKPAFSICMAGQTVEITSLRYL